MPLRIRYSRKGELQEITDLPVSPDDTIEQLRKRIAARIGLHWSRIELRGSDPSDKANKAPVRFTGERKQLRAFGAQLTDTTSVVWVKDLGLQFSYRGVFLLEYGGPLALMALFALRPSFLYSSVAAAAAPVGSLPLVQTLAPALLRGAWPSEGTAQWAPFVQCLAVAMYLAHYLKRELETCVLGRAGAASALSVAGGKLGASCLLARTLKRSLLSTCLPAPSFSPLLSQPPCAQV
jgi:hypothetical protein